jgi:hypothetical protein
MGSMNGLSSKSTPGLSAPSAPPFWREVQHFRQWWMWLVVLGVAALVMEVHGDRLRAGLAPFRRRGIALRDIATAEAVTYRPLADFGGWGVRWAGRRGVAYNASGNRGVQLVLADGRKVLVGSQRPEELAAALRSRGVPVHVASSRRGET